MVLTYNVRLHLNRTINFTFVELELSNHSPNCFSFIGLLKLITLVILSVKLFILYKVILLYIKKKSKQQKNVWKLE